VFLSIVEEMRREIVVALVDAGELGPVNLTSIQSRIDDIIGAYQQKFESTLTEHQRKMFVKGIQLVDTAVKSGDLMLAMPYLPEQKLQALQSYGATLIRGLTDYARARIKQEVELAVLGQKPAVEVIKEIGRNLSGPSVFGTVARRATVIHRTEVARVQNQATIDRIGQISQRYGDARKRWLHAHIGIPRPGHLALDRTTVVAAGTFELRSADGKIYHVQGPHDPILPVGEVVNCRCIIVPFFERFETK
jgi:hypothetical protein